MSEKIVNIETAMIARLPQEKGELWEVGRRALDASVVESQGQGDYPELLLAVQAGRHGGGVLASVIPSSAPLSALGDFMVQAMRRPLSGRPRRPYLVRVSSQPEGDVLRPTLAPAGVRLAVSSRLTTFDVFYEQIAMTLGGMGGDYRTQAARAGESLSQEGLQAFFRIARAFYRAELWVDFADEVMFDIEILPAAGPAKRLYAIVMGNMGEEYGLALYLSIEALHRFYELSEQHLDRLAQPPKRRTRGRTTPQQRREEAEMMSSLLSVSAIGLSFTPQKDVPSPLVQEAKQLKLPLANRSVFPLIMRTGEGHMKVGTATDMRDVYWAMQAILDWDKQIVNLDLDDEIGVTITSHLAAVADFVPKGSSHTTLRLNPCVAKASEDFLAAELSELLEALLPKRPPQKVAKKSKSSETPARSGKKTAITKTTSKGTGRSRPRH